MGSNPTGNTFFMHEENNPREFEDILRIRQERRHKEGRRLDREPLNFSHEYRTSKNTICPHCHKVTDGCCGDERGPQAGAFNICFYCTNVSVFQSDLTLRFMTENEKNDVILQQKLIPVLEKLRMLKFKEEAKKENIKVIELPMGFVNFWKR